jgi:hypothetical protein
MRNAVLAFPSPFLIPPLPMPLRTLPILAALLLLSTLPAAAQWRAPSLETAAGPAFPAGADTVPGDQSPEQRPPKDERMLVRGVAGALGWVAGAALGAGAGVMVDGSCGGCDGPGLAGFVVGGLVGGAVGSAAAAALPSMGARCGYGARWGRGVGGAAGGTLIGIGLTATVGEAGLVVLPLASIVGAAAGADC